MEAEDTSHLPSVGEHRRNDAARTLNATLVNLIDLSLLGKQPHWNIRGSEFRALVAMMIDGNPTLTLRKGDPFLISPGTVHNARDLGPDTGKMPSTDIVETDEPLARIVSGRAAGELVET